jgi:hypothetical protein
VKGAESHAFQGTWKPGEGQRLILIRAALPSPQSP